jgi:hypothetical protein
MAEAYLRPNTSFLDLEKQFDTHHCSIRHMLLNAGDKWVQEFHSKRFKIDKIIPTPVPALLPTHIIQKIRNKADANRTWEHGKQKYEYLLSRMIFSGENGRAMTGCSRKGIKGYRDYSGSNFHLNAISIEDAVIDELFEWLGSEKKFRQAIFEGHPTGKIIDELKQKRISCEKELAALKRKRTNLISAMERYLDMKDPEFLFEELKPRIQAMGERSKEITSQIQSIDNQLATLPTEKEITDRREWMKNQLLQRVKESWVSSRAPFDSLPFMEKRKFLTLILGGKDETGKRYGVYVWISGKKWGKKKVRYEIHGRLGNSEGWIEQAGEIVSKNQPNIRNKVNLMGKQPSSSGPSPRAHLPAGEFRRWPNLEQWGRGRGSRARRKICRPGRRTGANDGSRRRPAAGR